MADSPQIRVGGIADAIESAEGNIKRATINVAKTAASNAANQLLGNVLGRVGGVFGNLLGGLAGGGTFSNELDRFASYNYILSLGVLTSFEYNNPAFTYRTSEPWFTICRSGGGGNVRLMWEQGGKTEYFIDNLEFDTIITPTDATRLTNATHLTFDILEPYSMGNFLETLQVAAVTAGHKNYLQAPFCLTIQFKGWDDFGNPVTGHSTRRVLPIKIVNTTFTVDEEGSKYKVEAIPYNELAYVDENQTTHTDTQFVGTTVAEALSTGAQSLTTILNDRELEKVKAKQSKVANQYAIIFPKKLGSFGSADFAPPTNNNGATTKSSKDSSSEGMRELTEEDYQRLYYSITGIENAQIPSNFEKNIKEIQGIVLERSQLGEQIRDWSEDPENLNDIGAAKITKSSNDGGKMPMAKPGNAENENTPGEVDRCKVQRSGDVRTFSCSPGQKIQDLIESTVLASEFARKAVDAKSDVNGMVDWFRIESQVFIVDDPEQVAKTGEPAKIFVYRVLPYKVHRSVFQSPTQSSPGIQNLKTQALKEYNYIYTGKNKDVIDFDIKFDAAFFTAYHGDYGQLTKDSVQGGAGEVAGGNKRTTTGAAESNNQTKVEGKAKAKVNGEQNSGIGGPTLHPENMIAIDFNEALVNNPIDLMQIDLTIHGDPYFIADSGMGNYSSPDVGTLGTLTNILGDASINYQSGEVDIILNFRTPIDYNPSGWMDFPGGGVVPVRLFSGLYKLVQIKNSFSDGQFTQRLEAIRRRGQDQDIFAAISENTGAVTTAPPEKQLSETPEAKEGGGETE